MNTQICAARFAHRLAMARIEARPMPAKAAVAVSAKPSSLRILAAVVLALLMPAAAVAKGHKGGGHASHAKRSKKG